MLRWFALVVLVAGCAPAGPPPAAPTSAIAPVDTAEDRSGPAEPGSAALETAVVERTVEPAACMSAEDALAWANGRGSEVVAAVLARHLTDLTPADTPDIPAERVATWIRSLDAAPLLGRNCASLVVTLWFDPYISFTERAGATEAQVVAIFSPVLTEPAVAHLLCVGSRQRCRVLRLEDLDRDGRHDLLLERSDPDTVLPPAQVLYVFPDDSDPLPVWVSDDDAVRRALFGTDGEADRTNQMGVVEVAFEFADGRPIIRAHYRLFACGGWAIEPTEPCSATGEQTLVFTRVGDVYLLPDEPEPGAPWGRPEEGPRVIPDP